MNGNNVDARALVEDPNTDAALTTDERTLFDIYGSENWRCLDDGARCQYGDHPGKMVFLITTSFIQLRGTRGGLEKYFDIFAVLLNYLSIYQ